jgi:lipoprotein-anchoring transpeptidase ErfK/SrfK
LNRQPRRDAALVVVVLAAVVVAIARVFGGAGATVAGEPRAGSATQLADAAAALPAPARPAFVVGRPELLGRREARARFAPVSRHVTAVAVPRADAEPVATLEPQTEEGTTNVVLVIGEARSHGASWVHVQLPVLPNGRTGWVPRNALGGYGFVRTRLVVDRARLTATLFRDGQPIFDAPVGIGTPAAPTPAGDFYVRLKLAGFDDPFYGPVAFGTNARSAVLTDWPGGGYIGIHGTNAPGLIPGRVSHGCVRMRNEDIVALSRLLPVGTPLTIR